MSTFELHSQPPLPLGPLLAFLGARAIPGVEVVGAGQYRRSVRAGGRALLVEVLAAGDATIQVRADDAGRPDAARIESATRRLFDLDADPARIDRALGADALLAPLVGARPGLRRPGAFDGFELAVRAVLGQQVTVASASTLSGRLVAIAGEPIDPPSRGITHLFPSPDQVAEADLSALGVPSTRRKTIRRFAEEVASGRLVLDGSEDLDETTDRLLALPGIGPWTASYIAMRALGDHDAFPAGDLGLQRASSKLGGPATAAGLQARAERWRPWRAYAAMHLWTSSSDRRESRR